jgi:hypothetical protein
MLCKLAQLLLPVRTIILIRSFLSKRKLKVSVEVEMFVSRKIPESPLCISYIFATVTFSERHTQADALWQTVLRVYLALFCNYKTVRVSSSSSQYGRCQLCDVCSSYTNQVTGLASDYSRTKSSLGTGYRHLRRCAFRHSPSRLPQTEGFSLRLTQKVLRNSPAVHWTVLYCWWMTHTT